MPPIRSSSLAPRVFIRILRQIAAKVRSEGIRTLTVIYLDDHLLIHHQKDTLSKIFLYVRTLLSSLGFIVKLEKCSPESTRRLVFLGTVLDKKYMTVALPEEQQTDTWSMPGNARVSVNIPGWTGDPLGPHEPYRTDGTVYSIIMLQSPLAAAGSAASPVRMQAKVSDVRRTTSPRQVSTFSSGKYRFLGLMPKAEISY